MITMDDGGNGREMGGMAVRSDRDGIAEFAGLATRINAALDAMQAGLARGHDVATESGPDPVAEDFGSSEQVAALEDELETERSANAQLTDRVERLKDRYEATIARVEAEKAEARAVLAEVEGELRQLRAVNDRLRRTSNELRAACANGAVAASDVNEAMRSELDSLLATRASEKREMEALIGDLTPLVERENA